jgi:hypothetical protein
VVSFKIRTTVQINRNRSQKTFQVLTLENKTKGTPRGGLQMRSSIHVGERTVRHAHAELMREQQTTTHTLTNNNTHTHKHLKHTIAHGTCTNASNSGSQGIRKYPNVLYNRISLY